MRRVTTICLVAGVLAGCGDDLPSVTTIERMRLLGARVEVAGDPDRATPAPGEKATVRFVTVFPTTDADPSTIRSLFITCTPPNQFTGIPICQEFLDAAAVADTADPSAALDLEEPLECEADLALEIEGIGITCTSGDPEVSLTVPADFEGDGRLVRGVVCEDGVPFVDPFDPLLFGCKSKNSDAQAIRVHATVFVERKKSARNHNPDPTGFDFKFNGRDWDATDPAVVAAGDECEDAADAGDVLKASALERKHEIQIEYDPDVREKFEGEPETVEISSYGTAGEIERRFTIFDPDEKLFEDRLEWKSPKPTEVGSRGQLVRFFFTVIDQRGGFALTSRAVCLE